MAGESGPFSLRPISDSEGHDDARIAGGVFGMLASAVSICGGAFETRHAMIWAVLTLLRAPGGLPWQGTGHQ
jgi:hypothetical protein